MLLGTYVVVFITAPTVEEAEKIARALLEARLAACVSIVKDVKSLFWWRERIDEASEVLLIVKTRLEVLLELVKKVKEIHSYEVPEIIAIPVIGGFEGYLKWIDESLRRRGL